jgi:hypothetical protein
MHSQMRVFHTGVFCASRGEFLSIDTASSILPLSHRFFNLADNTWGSKSRFDDPASCSPFSCNRISPWETSWGGRRVGIPDFRCLVFLDVDGMETIGEDSLHGRECRQSEVENRQEEGGLKIEPIFQWSRAICEVRDTLQSMFFFLPFSYKVTRLDQVDFNSKFSVLGESNRYSQSLQQTSIMIFCESEDQCVVLQVRSRRRQSMPSQQLEVSSDVPGGKPCMRPVIDEELDTGLDSSRRGIHRSLSRACRSVGNI